LPDVPCLGDHSTVIGALIECDSAIVINPRYHVRASIAILAMLAVWVLFNENSIPDGVLMRYTLLVLTLEVLPNDMLLSGFDVLPICFEIDIKQCIAAKY
jgi:hypothetical protein